MGPIGSGKSVASCVKLMDCAANQAPGESGIAKTRWIVVRNTYGELRDTTEKTFFEWFPPNQCGIFNSTTHTYQVKGKNEDTGVPFDAEFLFRALDRPDHVAKLLSLEVTGGWVNEAREVPYEIIRMLQTRIPRYPPRAEAEATWSGLLLDTNPPPVQHWLYELFEKKKPRNAKLHKQPSGRGPNAENVRNLAKGYYDDLMVLLSEDEVKVYVDGEYGFIRSGQPVYPAYNDNLHCKEFEINPDSTLYRLWDWGLTPACVILELTPEGYLRVPYELCAKRAGADRFSDHVLKFCTTELRSLEFEDIGDPAGDTPSESTETSCFEIVRGKGINIIGGNQNPDTRIESVDLALRTLTDDGFPMFVLHPRCEVLRQGFMGGYQFKQLLTRDSMGDWRFGDKPDKNRYSHPHDALQYGCAEVLADLLTDRQRGRAKQLVTRGRHRDKGDQMGGYDEQPGVELESEFDVF